MPTKLWDPRQLFLFPILTSSSLSWGPGLTSVLLRQVLGGFASSK